MPGVSRHAKEIAKWFEENLSHVGDECVVWPFGGAPDHHGYRRIKIKRSGKVHPVPRAIAIEAHGVPPSETHQAAHTCGRGDIGCVNPSHIYWATPQENQLDRRKHGTDPRGVRQNTAKLTEEDVRLIRRLHGEAYQADIAKEFGVSRDTVQQIQYRKHWSHVKDSSFA